MKIILIFALGVGILIGAIALNIIASRIGLTSWYEFLLGQEKTSLFSYIWLFLIYPLGLGAVAYTLFKILNF